MNVVTAAGLRQGDVLRGARLFYQAGRLYSLVKRKRKLGVVLASSIREDVQRSIVPSQACDLAIVTQSCDIRKLETLILAPVFPIAAADCPRYCKPLTEGQANAIRAYRITWAYYMPERAGIDGQPYPESYVDLRLTCTVARSEILQDCTLVRRLDPESRERFRKLLSNCFGRPGVEDDILEAAKLILEAARHSNTHKRMHSMWMRNDGCRIELLAVMSESDPASVAKLEKAVNDTNSRGSNYQFSITCKLMESTTLADIRPFTPLALDYLSIGSSADSLSIDFDF